MTLPKPLSVLEEVANTEPIKQVKSQMVCVRFTDEQGIGIERLMAAEGYTNRSVWVRDVVAERIARGG